MSRPSIAAACLVQALVASAAERLRAAQSVRPTVVADATHQSEPLDRKAKRAHEELGKRKRIQGE